MQFLTVFPILAVLAVSQLAVQGDECTSDDLALIQSYASADGSAVCPDDLADPNICSTECQNDVMDMLLLLPECSIDGVNVNKDFQAAFDSCQTLDSGASISSESSGVFSDTSSSSVFTTDSSTTTTGSTIKDSTSATSDKTTTSTPTPNMRKLSGSSDATIAVASTTTVIAVKVFVFAAVL